MSFLPLAPLRRHDDDNGRYMVSFLYRCAIIFFYYLSIIIIFSFLPPPSRQASGTTWRGTTKNGRLMVFSLYRCVVFLLTIIVIFSFLPPGPPPQRRDEVPVEQRGTTSTVWSGSLLHWKSRMSFAFLLSQLYQYLTWENPDYIAAGLWSEYCELILIIHLIDHSPYHDN